ncbi:MAG: radical SAM protein [Candidatus Riflebacteria bacterium]|nr:radical SAM protein [Candidatus Riflebacteria bacterium]
MIISPENTRDRADLRGVPGLTHWDLISVEKPARYLGGEWNQAAPKPGANISVCLAFPDLYELGMSNIALKILYELLDADPRIAVERVFSPWGDFEEILRRKGIPLYGLESKRPLHAFDVLGITLPYEMTFTNVLRMLELGGIPLLGNERSSGPLIIAGGPSAANPLPVADFFDAILIGDGEEALPELCERVISWKAKGGERRVRGRLELLEEITTIEGFWVPQFPKPVRRRVFKGFASSAPPLKMIIPNVETIHNRVPLEIFRGCMQGCRFCNAGYFYRPRRDRTPRALIECAATLMRNTGNESVGLLSLSTSDYGCLDELVTGVVSNRVFPDQNITVPSLRMNEATLQLLKRGDQVKKSGLTFAPEAGSQRLRDVIGKKITEDDILRVIEATRESCYQTVKLYFMIGLPFETNSDVDAIAELVGKIDGTARRMKLRKDLSISLSPFVPKPFTPFQWAEQLPAEELLARRVRVTNALKRTRAKVSWREEFLCGLEAVLARGDERVGKLILAAHRKGCRFDGWGEQFRRKAWEESLKETGLTISEFARERSLEEKLPWDFIDFRTPRAFLEAEYRRAIETARGVVE